MATESHLQPWTFIHVLVFCLNLYPHPMICRKGTSFDQLFRMDWLKRKTNLGVCPAHPPAPMHWVSLDHAEFHLRQEISSRSLTPARFEQEILSISLTPATRFILSLPVKLYFDRKKQIYLYPSQHWDETNKEWKTLATTNIRYIIIKTPNDLHLE